nr:class I SAM-dependent methyltransferase [Aestuariivivens sediminis]
MRYKNVLSKAAINMFYNIIPYIKFLFKSTNQHGVHSPFVFQLITSCFYDKTPYPAYEAIVRYRHTLLQDGTQIKVVDLGAGSQVMTAGNRRVSTIAKHAGTPLKRAKLLYRLNHYLKCDTILELGTSLGIASHALHLGNPKAHITTLEGCPNTAAYAKQAFEAQGITRITSIVGPFEDTIHQLTAPTYDLVFFDGHHQKAATLHYFELLIDRAHNDSVFIFDDIHWSKGMTEAWETIKRHPRASVTLDTFFWGVVFFRKEQAKEHFTIRV